MQKTTDIPNAMKIESKSPSPDPKSLKILAKSIFRELRGQGYSPTQIVSFSAEIIELVTTELAPKTDSAK
jgi:hypothetical protein